MLLNRNSSILKLPKVRIEPEASKLNVLENFNFSAACATAALLSGMLDRNAMLSLVFGTVFSRIF